MRAFYVGCTGGNLANTLLWGVLGQPIAALGFLAAAAFAFCAFMECKR